MTDNETEARIATLEAHDQRRDSEYANLLKAFATLTEERDRERYDNAETEHVKWKWLDERLAELRARPHADGDESAIREELVCVYKGMIAIWKEIQQVGAALREQDTARLNDLQQVYQHLANTLDAVARGVSRDSFRAGAKLFRGHS